MKLVPKPPFGRAPAELLLEPFVEPCQTEPTWSDDRMHVAINANPGPAAVQQLEPRVFDASCHVLLMHAAASQRNG